MKKYHAHLYLPSFVEFTSIHFFSMPTGPHPLPMIEFKFNQAQKNAAAEWLRQHQGGSTILIHEDSGDDIHDHAYAQWLGEPVALDYSFFKPTRTTPT